MTHAIAASNFSQMTVEDEGGSGYSGLCSARNAQNCAEINLDAALDTSNSNTSSVVEGMEELTMGDGTKVVVPIGTSLLNPDGTPKSKNQLKNEAKKSAKLEKFMAKQAKATDLQKAGASTKMKTLDKRSVVDEALLAVPAGEKKPMDQPLADSYSPMSVESTWYSWWEAQGYFKPEYAGPVTESSTKFTIVIPPPNVTGSLHLGHTLTTAVQDSLCRWHRMQGHVVLYLPGSDHAGIATQAVVEKKLMRERGLTKHDLGREAFVHEIWKWKDTYGNRIYDQFRRMGPLTDWERVCFTLDPKATAAVNEAFCRLFEDGKIFRANRLVHWCGKLKTSVSDLEVDMMEVGPRSWIAVHGHDPKKKYEFGVMYSFAYKVEGSESEELVIATTRPETVFADVAVAVNPKDERYAKYHGRNVVHPVTGARLPVICDEVADPEFGTGALKISPGHDHTDFEVGQRHGLPCISVLTEENRLHERCGPGFAGLMRYEGREAVVAFCKANGTYRGDAPHAMSLPVCSRSGDFIEPRLIPQWWLNCRSMADKSLDAVRTGELSILPKDHEKDWFYWLENIRDWCLSRQLWWGHRVPAYRVHIEGVTPRDADVWVVGRSYEEALKKAQTKYPGTALDDIDLMQDEDVLDTWFSAALWPLTTLNWPNCDDADFRTFYPQSLLETGSDILFFWVARMTMMGQYLTGQLPFSQVFLHAMVRDAYGRKMSKSLGNVIDPQDVIEGCTLENLQKQLDSGNLDANEVKMAKEGQRRDFPHGIPECGADALRFGLCSYVAQGRDICLNIGRVEAYRRFCNKMWNAVRFALMKLGDVPVDFPDMATTSVAQMVVEATSSKSLVNQWMLAKLCKAADACNRNFASFNLMNVTSAIYQLWQYELCDVYIEAVKPLLAAGCPLTKRVLVFALDWALRLLHPMMPFITEELWQRLPGRQLSLVPSICVSSYPQADSQAALSEAEGVFDELFEMVKVIRSMATERKLVPKNTRIVLRPGTEAVASLFRAEESCLSALLRSVGNFQVDVDAAIGGSEEIMKETPRVHAFLIFSSL